MQGTTHLCNSILICCLCYDVLLHLFQPGNDHLPGLKWKYNFHKISNRQLLNVITFLDKIKNISMKSYRVTQLLPLAYLPIPPFKHLMKINCHEIFYLSYNWFPWNANNWLDSFASFILLCGMLMSYNNVWSLCIPVFPHTYCAHCCEPNCW